MCSFKVVLSSNTLRYKCKQMRIFNYNCSLLRLSTTMIHTDKNLLLYVPVKLDLGSRLCRKEERISSVMSVLTAASINVRA